MVKGMFQGGNANQMIVNFVQNDPGFRKFVQENQGKSFEQIAKEHGFDFNQILTMMR